MHWRGRAPEREVKLQLLGGCLDWRGRAHEREVKLQLWGSPQGSRATLWHWRGRVYEREVKLLLLGFPRNLVRLYEAIERSTWMIIDDKHRVTINIE